MPHQQLLVMLVKIMVHINNFNENKNNMANSITLKIGVFLGQ